jgi:hypothetical protein
VCGTGFRCGVEVPANFVTWFVTARRRIHRDSVDDPEMVAHLAGALGVPVWVLLPFCADWRWMVDRNDSPLYPTMRLDKGRLVNGRPSSNRSSANLK